MMDSEERLTGGTVALVTALVVSVWLTGNVGTFHFLSVYRWSWRLRTRDNAFQVNSALVNFLIINISCPTFLYLTWKSSSLPDDGGIDDIDAMRVTTQGSGEVYTALDEVNSAPVHDVVIVMTCMTFEMTHALVVVYLSSFLAVALLRLLKSSHGCDYVVPRMYVITGICLCWGSGMCQVAMTSVSSGSWVLRKLCHAPPSSLTMVYSLLTVGVVGLSVVTCYALIFSRMRDEGRVAGAAFWFSSAHCRASSYSIWEGDLGVDGSSGLVYCTAEEAIVRDNEKRAAGDGSASCPSSSDTEVPALTRQEMYRPGRNSREEMAAPWRRGSHNFGYVQDDRVTPRSEINVAAGEARPPEIVVPSPQGEVVFRSIERPEPTAQTPWQGPMVFRSCVAQLLTALITLISSCVILIIISLSPSLTTRVVFWSIYYFTFVYNPFVYCYSSKEFRKYNAMLLEKFRRCFR